MVVVVQMSQAPRAWEIDELCNTAWMQTCFASWPSSSQKPSVHTAGLDVQKYLPWSAYSILQQNTASRFSLHAQARHSSLLQGLRRLVWQ